MIHQYVNNGYHIVLDVNSGSVHVVDELCYDVIQALDTMGIDQAENPVEELKKEEINSWNEKYYEQYLQLKASGEKEYLFYRIKELKKENQ